MHYQLDPQRDRRAPAVSPAAASRLPRACSTVVDLLRLRAEKQGDRVGYSFQRGDGGETRSLTYGALDRRAQGVATLLQALCEPGERVLLVYPPGLDFVAAYFGCLYAGLVAVPVAPPHHAADADPLETIAADAGASRLLTTAAFLPSLRAAVQHLSLTGTLPALVTDAPEGAAPLAWRAPALDATRLAFLQYTSGSTGAPKGVMVEHGHLLHNLEHIRRAFGADADSRGVSWLPHYHDMGLIGGVLQPLYTGFPVTLCSPIDFLQRPLRWLETISRLRATISGGPGFAYELCARRVSAEEKAGLDLSSWEVAFDGAETIDAESLERFSAAFASCGFRREAFHPCYGLAEATLMVSAGPLGRTLELSATALEDHQVRVAQAGETARRVVPCGPPRSSGQRVLIVDPHTRRPCPPDRVGEVWVAGRSVTGGYWGRPRESAAAFQARRADTGDGPFLRTGDLGFIHGGQLYISGRLKDLIVVRGRNHAPEDLEATLARCHPALRPGGGAAFALALDGEERVVVVHEIERRHWRQFDPAELLASAREALATRHGLRLYALIPLKPGALPRTSSGKVRRQACRQAFLEGRLTGLAAKGAGVDACTPPPARVAGVEKAGLTRVGPDAGGSGCPTADAR